MHEGQVQQVDVPHRLYNDPANVFVAAFIGSPPMNLVLADIEAGVLRLGEHRIPVGPGRYGESLPDGRVVAGLRPEAFEDTRFAEPGLPQIEVDAAVVEELGSDTHVLFSVDAEPVVVEATRSDDGEDDGALLVRRDRARFVARVDPRTGIRPQDRLRLSVDARRLYFFDPVSGGSLARTAEPATA